MRGRLADRRGLLIGTATVAGLVNPPLSPGLRSLWSRQAGARLAPTAFALDAAVFDLAYITGPVLASGLATGLAPAAAVAVLLALTGAAAITIAGPSRRTAEPEPAEREPGPANQEPGPANREPGPANREPAPARRPRPGPLRSAGLRRLLTTAALTNAAVSATEVALTAYVRHHHALWAAGPLLAEVSIGSILGSLFLANQGHRLRRLLAGYASGLAVLAAAGLYAPLLAVAAPLAGLCLGPTLATLFGAAARAAPPGSGTETQAWVNSIMNGGAAGGAALAGFASARPVLALCAAAGAALAAALSAHHDPFGRNSDGTAAERYLCCPAPSGRP